MSYTTISGFISEKNGKCAIIKKIGYGYAVNPYLVEPRGWTDKNGVYHHIDNFFSPTIWVKDLEKAKNLARWFFDGMAIIANCELETRQADDGSIRLYLACKSFNQFIKPSSFIIDPIKAKTETIIDFDNDSNNKVDIPY